MRNILVLSVFCAGLTFSHAAMAQSPVDNVGNKHRNLEAAQHLCTDAYNRLVDSQKDNAEDEGGHAQKAKELLDQANKEIAQAAMFDNAHKK